MGLTFYFPCYSNKINSFFSFLYFDSIFSLPNIGYLWLYFYFKLDNICIVFCSDSYILCTSSVGQFLDVKKQNTYIYTVMTMQLFIEEQSSRLEFYSFFCDYDVVLVTHRGELFLISWSNGLIFLKFHYLYKIMSHFNLLYI